MTWEEWVNSEYNTDGYYIISHGGYDFINDLHGGEISGVAYKTDLIGAGYTYKTQPSSFG